MWRTLFELLSIKSLSKKNRIETSTCDRVSGNKWFINQVFSSSAILPPNVQEVISVKNAKMNNYLAHSLIEKIGMSIMSFQVTLFCCIMFKKFCIEERKNEEILAKNMRFWTIYTSWLLWWHQKKKYWDIIKNWASAGFNTQSSFQYEGVKTRSNVLSRWVHRNWSPSDLRKTHLGCS